jgi:hypothetical protein
VHCMVETTGALIVNVAVDELPLSEAVMVTV